MWQVFSRRSGGSKGGDSKAAPLLNLSTIAEAGISNPPWVKFQSAGWVNFPSAPTVKITVGTLRVTTNRPDENGGRARYSFEISRLPVLCPLAALEDWLAHSKNSTHYLFPHITKLARSVPVGAPSVHEELNKMIADNNREKINIRSFRYGLYFFFAKNGWPAKKILKHLPFYQKNAVDSRIRHTQRVRYCDLPVLSKEEISKIKLVFSQSHYHAA